MPAHALFLMLALATGGAEVYRWVDANGQVHFSDRAGPGAERVVVTVPQAATPDVSQPRGTFGGTAGDAEPAIRYRSLTIANPRQDEVLWNIEGQLEVEAAVQPELVPGHILRFYLDGRMTPAPPGTTRVQLSEVFRGEHSLRVEVVNEAGQSLVSSPAVRFFVRQTSLANPVTNPGPTPRGP